MGTNLCSREFKSFYHEIHGNIADAREMLLHIGERMPYIADMLYLGKCDAYLDAPSTLFSPQKINNSVTIFEHENGYSAQAYTKRFITGEKGNVSFTAYPQPDHVWTPAELDDIDFLLESIFVLSGRSRLMGLVKKAAIVDTMTGAPNTAGLTQFADALREKRQFQNYTGIFINIKNFKFINKTLGSKEANFTLKQLCIDAFSILDSDECFARLGGDNFFALIKDSSVDHFLKYFSEMTISIGGNDPKTIKLPFRMGIYSIQENDTTTEMMNGASIAINVARSSTADDYVWYTPAMQERVMHEKEISLSFRHALTEHEFVVYYQPKVKLNDDTLCGCEALVRWYRSGKLVPPMEFIPILEQEGSICDLDFYVLEQVCKDICKWIDAGIEPVCVSVNFSKIHLHDKELAQKIISIIDQYHVDSRYIEIELTEMSGHQDYNALVDFINIMKAHGIKTSIDDFGTGYSSLNLLKGLNVNIIKLDKSFLNDVEHRTDNEEIVIRHIIHLINELGMTVIAEGVETTEQAQFLRSAQCEMAQGFLYDRPMPENDFQQRLIHKSYN